MTDEKYKQYGESENSNFRIIDSIGVPHPYCITPKHIEWAADHYGGMLGQPAIEDAEKNGAKCDICKNLYKRGKIPKILSWSEHQKAVLVECDTEIEDNKELHQYLLKIKAQVEQDGYSGFAFVKSKKLKGSN